MEEKILIIDDEQVVCDALKKFLTKKEYKVSTALSGEEGIKKIKINEDKPHIVLLDIRMPGMDGIETLKKIREIDKNIGIIMVTAVKENEVGRKCMELGAYDYIIKPFSIDYLETVLMVKLFDYVAN